MGRRDHLCAPSSFDVYIVFRLLSPESHTVTERHGKLLSVYALSFFLCWFLLNLHLLGLHHEGIRGPNTVMAGVAELAIALSSCAVHTGKVNAKYRKCKKKCRRRQLFFLNH